MLLYEFLPALETKKKVCNCRAIYDILLYMLLYKLFAILSSHKVYKKFSIFGQHDMLLYKLLAAFLLQKKKKKKPSIGFGSYKV